MPLKGRPRNPLAQEPERFHRLRPLGGDTVAVDTAGETPTRFHEIHATFVGRRGVTPGLMETDTRGSRLAPGIVRTLWRQLAAFIPGPPAFQVSLSPAVPQRQLRYKTTSYYLPAGSDNSRFSALHTVILQKSRSLPPNLSGGVRRGMPTTRNRITSFGSRVTPLNRRLSAAEELGNA